MKIITRLTEEYIDKFTQAGYWINKTFDEYLDEAVEAVPDKVVIVEGDNRITYRQLGQMVNRMALGFLELGIQKGDVVSFELPTRYETVAIHHALAKIGAVSNPIVPIYRSREVSYILKNAESRLMIIPHIFRKFNYVEMIEDLRKNVPNLKHVLVMEGKDLPLCMLNFKKFMETPWEELRDPAILKNIKPDPNDVILLMFTSGTEAEPKGVLHTSNTLIHEIRSIIETNRLGMDDVVLMPTPVTHITGLLFGLEMPVMLKGKVVMMDMWNADEAIKLIEREKCTWTVGATPFLVGITRSSILADHDISSLKSFGCGGAECPPTAIKEFVTKVPTCRAARGYGSTEYPTVSIPLMAAPLEKASGRDGLPVMGTRVKIINDDGSEVPVGVSGEILVKGPECFVGYLDSSLNDKYFEEDGWFHMGDLGRVDKDGYVEVTGRKKDIIIRGGENISVKEVEDSLFMHPAIESVSVVSMPDPVMQERGCAYVIPKAGKTIVFEDMISFLKTTDLAKQKWPERLEIVDEFPMTISGKIKKYVLRQDIRDKLNAEKVNKP